MPKYIVLYANDDDPRHPWRKDLDAEDMDAALALAESEAFDEDGVDHDENRIVSITVVPLAHASQVDCKAARVRRAERDATAERAAQDARERAEYQRLRAKFGG